MPLFIVFVVVYLCAALSIALLTLWERKILGYMQLRKGPNKVAIIGLVQPLADVLKLLTKEQNIPTFSIKLVFLAAPALGLMLSFFMWSFCPRQYPVFFARFCSLVFLCISRISVYATLLSGWASNSKYALLGRLRGIAQTVSYEVSMALIILSVLILHESLELRGIISANFFLFFIFFPVGCVWLVTCLAETNRTPFDLAEGESELVSGLNVEYRATPFAFLFMREYINIIFIRMITSMLLFNSSRVIELVFFTMVFNLAFI